MKKIVLLSLLFTAILMTACSQHEGLAGTFVNKFGTKFELKPDSTTLIVFQDSINYEGKWAAHFNEQQNIEYATIEFANDDNYYFVRGNKIYRKKADMLNEQNGVKISYKD